MGLCHSRSYWYENNVHGGSMMEHIEIADGIGGNSIIMVIKVRTRSFGFQAIKLNFFDRFQENPWDENNGDF